MPLTVWAVLSLHLLAELARKVDQWLTHADRNCQLGKMCIQKWLISFKWAAFPFSSVQGEQCAGNAQGMGMRRAGSQLRHETQTSSGCPSEAVLGGSGSLLATPLCLPGSATSRLQDKEREGCHFCGAEISVWEVSRESRMGNNTVLLISLMDVSWQPAPGLTQWEQRYQTQSCKCSERNSIFLKVMLCLSEKKAKER